MKALSEKQIANYLAEAQKVLHIGECKHKEHKEYLNKVLYTNARVEMPLGELTNEGIKGHLWGLTLKYGDSQNWCETKPIEKNDRFNAQGLEGKAVVTKITLLTALFIWRELPRHRCNIYLEV